MIVVKEPNIAALALLCVKCVDHSKSEWQAVSATAPNCQFYDI